MMLPLSLAATVVLAIGSIGGFVLGRRTAPSSQAGNPEATTPFLAAARVQETGSQYLAAVAALQRLDAHPSADASIALTQGYEAALVVVEAVARTVDTAEASAGGDGKLVEEAARARASMDARVSRILYRGGTP